MSRSLTAALDHAGRHATGHLARVCHLVRIPSVSVDPAHEADVRRAARWLGVQLAALGMEVRIVPGWRHPAVIAQRRLSPDRPTVLIYGHYDVQPPGPRDRWSGDPFLPRRRGDDLLGRGASDDKGQLLSHVAALESYVATSGELPLNVVCLFEGEEEIGSPGLETVLRRHARALRADAAVLSDTSMPDLTRPAITYALRGLLSCEVEARGGRREVHSGTYGGAIANPLHGLCTLVDSLHDGEGRIAIDGIYDRVAAPSRGERTRLRREGPTDGAVAAEAGVTQGWGEPGWSLFERTVLRPSLSVTGIMGGYSGSGVKSAIGPRGLAKLSLRLVPDQRPGEIAQLLRRHLAGLDLPGGLRVGMRVVSAAPPVVVDVSHPAMRAAEAACVAGFGGAPALLRSGGSIPAVGLFQTHLGIDTIILGFGLPSDRAHGPDERLHIPTFLRGVRTSIHLLARLPDALGVKRRTPTPGSPRNALWSAGRLPWEKTACM